MSIPDYQTLMLPVLKAAANGEVKTAKVVAAMEDLFGLTDEERRQLMPGSTQTVIYNRTHWAKFYLDHAGLVAKPKRGYFIITDRGRKVLAANPPKIDNRFLSQFPEFVAFKGNRNSAQSPQLGSSPTTVSILTPDEVLRETAEGLNDELRSELLNRLLTSDPSFFEYAVVSLLEAMGYGGANENPGKIIGKPGDGGLDGAIDGDALGLDRVYIQAKRYKVENKISAPDVQAFFGAVAAAKATKGVFVTTSDFTPAALQFAEKVQLKLVLINGERLTKLMLRYNVGVRIQETLYIKKLDEDFFTEE